MLFLSYIPLLIVAVFLLLKTNKENGFTGAYSGFLFAMIFYYIIIPFGLYFSKASFYERNRYGFKDIVEFVFEKNPSDYIFAFILTIIGFACFHLAYRYSMITFVKESYSKVRKSVFDFAWNDKFIRIIKLIAAGSFLIGILSILIHTVLVGGVGSALSIAEAYRGFDASLGDVSFLASVTKITARFITIAAILYLALFFDKRLGKHFILFFISFIGSIYYYLLNAGRMPLLTFLIIFLFLFLNQYMKNVWIKIMILGVLALPLIDWLSYIFIYFETGELQINSFDFANYMRQLSPAYNQLLNVRDITGTYGFQYFRNIITDVVDLLPGIGFEQSYEVTSTYFNGPNWRSIGGVPNDVISFGYMQLGVMGVAITLGIWGKIMYFIDMSIRKVQNKNIQHVISVAVATQIFQVVHAADIAPILKSNLIFMSVIFIILVSNYYYMKQNTFSQYIVETT